MKALPPPSLIAKKIIRVAQRVYEEHPVFGQAISPTRLAMENGNTIDRLSRNTKLFDTFEQHRLDLRSIRTETKSKVLLEKKRRRESVVDVDVEVESSIPLDPYNYLKNEQVKTHKKANCGELAMYFQHLLYEAGIPTLRILANILDEAKSRVCSQHVFLVAGLDPTANLFDPSSYGDHATYLDAWWRTKEENGLFVPVRMGLQKIKDAFELEKGEFLEFQPDDDYCDCYSRYKFPTFATVGQLPSRFRNP